MAAAVDTGMEKADMKRLLVRSKKEPVHCAVAQPERGAHAMLLMDKIKQPRAVMKMLEDSNSNLKYPRWGSVSVDVETNPKLAVFQLNKPAPGMARRLIKTLKGTGFTKVQVLFDDGSPAENHEEEEAPEEAAAAPEGAPKAAGAVAGAADGHADAARQAALTRRLADVAKQIAQAGDDPGRQHTMLTAANAAQTHLKTGDLDGAERLTAGLEEVLGEAAAQGGGVGGGVGGGAGGGAAAHASRNAPPPNLFPASTLQDIADKPAPAPTAPSGPPDGVLARAGDGRKYWRPAGADAGAAPVAGKDWLEQLLRFYRAGPARPADSSGATCSFNGKSVAVSAALDIVDAQAALGGYKPNRAAAGGIIQDLLKEAAENQSLADQIAGDVGGQGDLGADRDKLDALPMTKLLGVLDRLVELKKFEALTNRMTGVSDRLGAAIVTVRGDFEDIQWQSLVPKLNQADRAAVIMRAPAKIRKVTPGPAKAGEKEEPLIEAEAVGGVSKDGMEVQVKLTAHSPLGNNVGETEFTVHVGPDGKVAQFELDVTAFQQSLLNKGAVAEVTATVSGNATMDMAQGGSKIAPNGINAQVKAELAARLTRVKVLQGVTVKLTGTYGTGGPAVSFGLEFKIPGT